MRARYAAIGFVLLLISFVFYTYAQQPQQISQQINQSINSTGNYIESVNQSGYLVFYPNLTQSYKYFYEAKNVSKTNPILAMQLLSQASQSATNQLNILNQKRQGSLYVMLVLTAIVAAILYVVMKPKKYKGKSKS